MNNISFMPDTVYVHGKGTHFNQQHNTIGFSEEIITNYGWIKNQVCLNDTLIRFELYLPIPVKQAVDPNIFLWVYNPVDSILLYPLRIDLYGGIHAAAEKPKSLQVYPNPVKQSLYFPLEGLSLGERFSCEIWSMDGKRIRRQEMNNQANNRVEVSTLTPGMYFIVVKSHGKSGGKSWFGKFVRE
jgi:hypothetical protein